MNDDLIKRIQKMDSILEKHTAALEKLNAALDEYEESNKGYQELSDYYSSQTWFDDYDAEAAGELPEDMTRAVLSEDAVFNLIGEQLNTAIRMLETGTEAVKNG